MTRPLAWWAGLLLGIAFWGGVAIGLADEPPSGPLAPVTSPAPAPRPETTEGGFAPVHPVRVLSLANAMLNDGDAMFCRGRIVLALRGACAETAEVRNITPTTVGQIGGTE